MKNQTILSLGKPKSLEGPSQEPGTKGQPNSVFHYRIVFHYGCPEVRGWSPHRPMLGMPGSHREMKSNNVLGWLLPRLAQHGGQKEVEEHSCCTSSLETFRWLPTNDDHSLCYPAPSFCFPLMPALPCLQALALAVPSAPCVLPTHLQRIGLPSSRSQSKCLLFGKAIPDLTNVPQSYYPILLPLWHFPEIHHYLLAFFIFLFSTTCL